MKLENSKGTRDFGPEDKILRNEVVSRLTKVFELYGYSPLETPIIERYELLAAKAGAGEDSDALKEIFKLTDQGERKLGLKFEQTLSFARFIGMNPVMKMPFKRYEVGPVFRDGPIKLGRYRQFWQCDVDVVGCKDMAVDAEILNLALDGFKALELDAYLEVNNRKLLKGIIEFAGIKPGLADSVIISVDKLAKIGRNGVKKELEEKKIEDEKIDKLLDAFDVKGSNAEKLSQLKAMITSDIGKEGLTELEELFSYLAQDTEEKVVFSVSLARGLGYYTGTIFEGFMRKGEITSSICGGGRYDKMIQGLLGNNREYPCIGISFGLDVISDVMRLAKKHALKTVARVYVIPIKTTKECFAICKELRDGGISTDMDFSGKGISRNLDYVNALKIPFAIIAGPNELAEKKVKLKDMNSGEEELVSVKEAIKKIS
ncbi:histidine--tRNA ligase [Candidatus Woesearchaeota archaeon]|nr:histidine--tRNA ligase [Candidatus Woesearchaeota archaeon]